MNEPLLSIRQLNVQYATRQQPVQAVIDVDLDVARGEIVGIVGESGSGKSTLGRALMRMIDSPGRITDGEVILDGTDLMKLSERDMRKVRGTRIGMVFQDPMTSLVPVEKVLTHIRDTVRAHDNSADDDLIRTKASDLIERLGVRSDRLDDYPHQLSGGMRQRIMIAIALILDAEIVIADEPTTALDVVVEAHFLDLLRELRDDLGLTILFITHNISVVAEIADRVAVMYAGRLVEVGPVDEIFASPKHPYTQGLLRSVPSLESEMEDLYKMDGSPPNLMSPPTGCAFHPRCPDAIEVCSKRVPSPLSVLSSKVACWLYEEERAEF